jgi:WD40 repeat protein
VDFYAIEKSSPQHRHTQPTGPVEAVALSPSGDRLGIAGQGKVEIYQTDGWAGSTPSLRVRGEIVRLQFAPTGDHIAVLFRRRPDRRLDVLTLAVYGPDGRRLASWPVNGLDSPIVWSPDGTMIACVQAEDVDHRLEVRSLTDGRVLRRWPPQDSDDFLTSPTVLAWSSDGRRIAMGGGLTAMLAVWTPEEDHLDQLPGGKLRSASWSRDGAAVAVSAVRAPVRIIHHDRTMRELPEATKHVRVRWSPTAPLLAVADSTAISLYRDNGEHEISFAGGGDSLGAFDWAPDGKRIALSRYDFFETKPAETSVWDATAGVILNVMTGDAHPARLAFCPNGVLLASQLKDGAVVIWNSASGDVVSRWDMAAGRVTDLGWAPDGRRIAVSIGEQIRIWDVTTTAEDARCTGREKVAALCWSADGAHLAGVGDAWITVWNSADGKPVSVIRIPAGASLLDLRWETRLTLTFDDGVTAGWDVPLEALPDDLDIDARHRLTVDDRRRHALPPSTDIDRPAAAFD